MVPVWESIGSQDLDGLGCVQFPVHDYFGFYDGRFAFGLRLFEMRVCLTTLLCVGL
jgi:hypothetical protein